MSCPRNVSENSTRLIGNSHSISQVKHLIEQVSGTDATVLILGESGSGKEVVAQNIHAASPRRDKPFVAINCGAIPQELLESELFGHEKGAFTGAVNARIGRFEMAEGGTLFLDEIGDMPMHMQVKLLRVLQERVFERVGGAQRIKADVRVIAATHRNLEQSIDSGDFRLDLFYRLNVFPIELSSLRERTEDIPLLIEEFCRRQADEPLLFSDGAMRALNQYDWPGNVRELANLLERLNILCTNRIVQVTDLPEKYRNPNNLIELRTACNVPSTELIPEEGIDLKDQLQRIEISLIREALESADWVVARSAKMLNLQRTTLVEKMRKYAIDRAVQAS